ncbi:MAG: Trk system potassium transporter TrkA [Oscillospiraceae bacterium]|nr:Trk system potassium transporter TrkA [Oscillospiraceae bacterium]
MLVLIVGIGKVGDILTEYISKEGHNIVIIDIDPKILETTINKYDVLGILGSGTSHNILVEAGARKADLLIAVTTSDEMNILCCLMAKCLGTKNIIARVRDPVYSQQRSFMSDELGLNMTINPEYEAAYEMSRILRFPSAIKTDIFAKGRVELAEIKLGEDNPLNGHMLSELSAILKARILICAVQRGNEVIIPSGNFKIESGDYLYITASHQELSNFFKSVGIYRERVRTVMIIGGSNIAYYLAELLDGLGMNVKLVEKEEQRCLELSDLLPNTKIIYGDGADRALLLEEGIENVDACVLLTSIDEENIILSMYAKKLGVRKVITKIDRTSFTDLLGSLDLESIISPKTVTSNNILRYIRAMNDTMGGSVQTLYKLVDGKIEALEFLVKNDKLITGIPLRDLKLKSNLLVACLIRGNKIIYPRGGDTIEPGDGLIIVTNHIIKDIDDILL